LPGPRGQPAGRQRRSFQPATARKRHRQLRQGGPAPARADRLRPRPGPSSAASRHVRGADRMAALAPTTPRAAPPLRLKNRHPAHNPWAIALTVTMATFMELLDTSIANVSLPHIAGGLSASIDEATWVLTSYLVSNAIVLPMSAWLSTLVGRKRFYMSCVALFTLSSFICGLAPTLSTLIIFRVLQG